MNRTENKTVTHYHEVRYQLTEDEVVEIIRKHVRSLKNTPVGDVDVKVELDCGGGGYLRGAGVTITSVTTENVA
jgi:hypothetical protein